MIKVVHYTSEDDWSFKTIRIVNGFKGNKPDGALWTSPVNSEYGWMDWCLHNEYGLDRLVHAVVMNIHTNRCLKIDSRADALKMPWAPHEGFSSLWWCDFEKIAMDYDAIWLTVNGEDETRLVLENSLYGWDCESICILRSRAIDDIKIFHNGGLQELERRASVA